MPAKERNSLLAVGHTRSAVPVLVGVDKAEQVQLPGRHRCGVLAGSIDFELVRDRASATQAVYPRVRMSLSTMIYRAGFRRQSNGWLQIWCARRARPELLTPLVTSAMVNKGRAGGKSELPI